MLLRFASLLCLTDEYLNIPSKMLLSFLTAGIQAETGQTGVT